MSDPRSKSPPPSSATRFPLPADLIAPRRPPSAPRYSLRTLLILMTVVAVVVAVVGYYGTFVLTLLTSALVFGAVVVCLTCAIYCRGWRQAFFIGATCAACATALNPPRVAEHWGVLLLLASGELLAMAVAGGIAVVTRHFIEKCGWNVPRRDPRDNLGE